MKVKSVFYLHSVIIHGLNFVKQRFKFNNIAILVIVILSTSACIHKAEVQKGEVSPNRNLSSEIVNQSLDSPLAFKWLEQNQKNFQKYKDAVSYAQRQNLMKNCKECCNNLNDLKDNTAFPLHEMAHIRYQLLCAEKIPNLEGMNTEPSNQFQLITQLPWIKSILGNSHQNSETFSSASRERQSAISPQLKRYWREAKSLWSKGNLNGAEKVLKRAEKVLKGQISLQYLYYALGRIEEEKQDFQKSIEYFQEALNEPEEKNDFSEKIMFQIAWNFNKMGNWEESSRILSDLIAKANDPSLRSKYKFWLARIFLKIQNKESAQILFRELQEEDPLGYYGLIAYREVKVPFPPLQYSENKIPEVPHSLSDAEISIVEGLDQVGEVQILEDYILYVISKAYQTLSFEIMDYYLYKLFKNDQFLTIFSIVSKMSSAYKSHLLSNYSHFIFPYRFKDLVDKSSDKYKISKSLIYAIMRQESAFNPKARSSANARGLMQLLPSTAKRTSELKMKKLDLFDPEINIPIGSSFLKNLMEQYNNQILFVSASYNANPKALKKWYNLHWKNDPIEFIEDIPYDETKTYVKLIIRNYIFYNRLLSPEREINFPEELLPNLIQNSDISFL